MASSRTSISKAELAILKSKAEILAGIIEGLQKVKDGGVCSITLPPHGIDMSLNGETKTMLVY
jgi:FKBP-type peptidyl-prolyl cis-trans isomerase